MPYCKTCWDTRVIAVPAARESASNTAAPCPDCGDVPYCEHAANVYHYHTTSKKGDPQWAGGWLERQCRNGNISKEELAQIMSGAARRSGEAVQLALL